MLTKVCGRCKSDLPISEFHKHKKQKDGLTTVCKTCSNAYAKAWQKRNPERVAQLKKECYERNKTRDRDANLKRRYGITAEDWDHMFKAQEGVCKICKEPAKMYRLHVDHCHTTGVVRGLLCTNCNTALGLVKDNVEILNTMRQYLMANQ